MKKFDVFFSWQSDLLAKEYKYYIWKEIEKTCKNLNTEEIKVTPTESTRGNAGAVEIKDTVLSKIANCQIFICDVSIIGKINDKGTSNPNVMFELGYAVSCLGWERIVLVFNEASGKINDLPFDIRNHRILSYNIGAKTLSLKEPILSIIKQYDNLVGNSLNSLALKFDIQIFNKRCYIVSEDKLIESIKHSIDNAGYSTYDLKIWDKLWNTYENDESQKFRDVKIHDAYSSFLEHLREYLFVLISITGTPEHRGEYYEDMSKEEKEEDKKVWYKLKDYYALGYDDNKAEELHQKDLEKFMAASKDILLKYNIFRTLIREKLFL